MRIGHDRQQRGWRGRRFSTAEWNRSRPIKRVDQNIEIRTRADALDRIHLEDDAQARHAAELHAAGKRGICEDCGEKIEPERLEFLPDATRCVVCQARKERQSNRGR